MKHRPKQERYELSMRQMCVVANTLDISLHFAGSLYYLAAGMGMLPCWRFLERVCQGWGP